MKKFLLTMLLSVMLICVLAATATASYGFELNTSELSSVEAGQTVTVDVTVDNITVDGGLEAIDFVLTYSDNLTYSNAAATLPDGWEFWTPVSNTSDRTLKLAAVDEGSVANPAIENGDITVTITFVVASDFDNEKITLDFSRVGASASGSYEFVSGLGNNYVYYYAPESLNITHLPIKTTYTAGQSFYSNGLKVSATFSDGTVVEVTDFTVEVPDMMTEGVKDVVVKWGNISTTFQITVNAPLLSKITVTPPTKLSYYVGDSLDKTGMAVIASYANNTSADVTGDVTITPATFTTTGTVTVTVKFGTKSSTFTVTVTEKPASSDIGGTIGSIEWSVAGGVLTVSGEGAIPNYTKASNAPWTAYAKQITKIVVSDGVTGIGNYAFYKLSKATSIEVAESVVAVGQLFLRDSGITEIALPGVVDIVVNAFGASSVGTIAFSEAAKGFKGNVFGSSQTVTIKAPEGSFAHKYAELYAEKYGTSNTISYESDGTAASLPIVRFTSAGDNAFFAMYQNAKGNWLLEVSGTGVMKNFPYVSDKNIARGYTFSPMYYISEEGLETKVATITVHEGITSIGNYIFYKCTKATTVTLPEGIKSVGQGAFRLCQRITKITLPEAVTKIEKNAFLSCGKLTEVYIPEGVTIVGEGIFEKCTLANLTVKTKSAAAIAVISAEYPTVTIVSDF